jgi:hypothetical protein
MKSITTFVAVGLFCTVAGHVSAAQLSSQAHAMPFVAAQQPVLTAQADIVLPTAREPIALHAKGPGERGAAIAATKGPEALRRYIGRTQTIYALRYQDFISQ